MNCRKFTADDLGKVCIKCNKPRKHHVRRYVEALEREILKLQMEVIALKRMTLTKRKRPEWNILK